MVRLSELINQARRRASEGKSFVQNPTQLAWQWSRKRLMLLYGKASLGRDNNESPTQNPDSPPSDQPVEALPSTVTATADSYRYPDADSQQQVPVSSALLPTDKRTDQPLFATPILQPGERLQGGWWGVYTIKSCVYAKDWIRRYEGLQDNGGEPVWIYEYCLDKDSWSEEEIDERKQRFKHLIDLNLRLGDGADFRVVRPKDVIKPAGNRLYLITRPVFHSFTLNEFLAQHPTPWNRSQIKRFLTQVLQSLQYLQTYLVNWPGDRWEQGLSHGNLSSECLWLRLPEGQTTLKQSPFFVYLGRFPLWEHLFWPQSTPIAQHNREIGSIDDDLYALAHIVFALARGYQSEADPTDLSLWPEDEGVRVFYPYVLQLMGRGEQGGFKSIDSAISVLQTLPETYAVLTAPEPLPVADEAPTTETSLILPLLLGGGLLLALLTWAAVSFRPGKEQQIACRAPCRLEDVSSDGLQDSLKYGIEAESSWSKAFFRRLTSPLALAGGGIRSDITELQQTLEERDPSFALEKASDVLIPTNLLLEYLRTDSLDVAFVQNPLNLSGFDLFGDLEKQVVGYDGIAVFVTHSNAQRRDSVPKRLQGQISLHRLRQVLLDPTVPIDGARVELYWPENERTVDLLRDTLFEQDDDKRAFDRRRREENPSMQIDFSDRDRRQAPNMYERMVRDFESGSETDGEDVIGIGFNRISQVMGQCSVYPLAIADGGRTHHLFVDAEGDPIDQTTDLCGDKGTYWVNDQLFQPQAVTYPMAAEMSVVYRLPVNGESCDRYAEGCARGQLMADKLLTPEGQYLLSEVGLVPVLPIKTLRRMIWSPMAQGGTP